MDTLPSLTIVEFGRSTRNVCLCVSVAIILILLFIMSPINKFILSSRVGKLAILIILGYAIFYNISQTTKFSNKFDISLISGEWDHMKTNMICSWILTLFIIILFYNVFKTFF
jgi:hypothetical protein